LCVSVNEWEENDVVLCWDARILMGEGEKKR